MLVITEIYPSRDYGSRIKADMNVCLCRISVRIYGISSLKEKRRVSQSMITKVRRRFNVAISEVEHNDLWQRLTLGIACISNDGIYNNKLIDGVIDYIDRLDSESDVIECDKEVITGF